MKKLFIVGCLLLPTALMAQDCKQVKQEVDKFSKKETRVGEVTFGRIKMMSMKPSTKWLININQEEGKTSIIASIAALGEYNQVLDQNAQFYFLMDNGTVVKLQNKENAKPVTQAVGGNGTVAVFTTYILTLQPTKEELAQLSSGLLTDVKVEVPDQKIQAPEVDGKQAKKFKSIIECMAATAQ